MLRQNISLSPRSIGAPYLPRAQGLVILIILAAAGAVAWWAVELVGVRPVTVPTIGLGWTLLILGYFDIRSYRLPNAMTMPLICVGLGVGAFVHLPHFIDHAAGALAGYLLLWSVAGLYRALRGREGVGRGDAKLLAAGGAWVAWQGLPTILLYATGSALLFAVLRAAGGRSLALGQPLPFGPFLAIGIWLTWLYGPLMWS